ERLKSTSEICRVGDTASPRLIVLLGDSHALMWLPTVLELARRDGWVVVPLLRTGCMPNRWTRKQERSSCQAWYRWALREARLLHPSITLVAGSIGERPSPTV